MSGWNRPTNFLSSPWLVSGASVLALAVLTLLLWSPWNYPAGTGRTTLRFYCAAGSSKPVAEIIRAYQEAYDVEVQVTFDGSGKLLSTIRAARGEGDLYLAADSSHMLLAQREGLVAEVIPVAVLRPVLVVNARTQQALRQQGKAVASVKDLLRDDLKVVLANPELASIGQLGREILSKPEIAVWPRLEKRLKDGSAQVSTVGTVQEVAQAVRTNDRSIGIVWSANAAQFESLEMVSPPEFVGVSETLQIGVLSKSKVPTAALRFARYLTARDQGSLRFAKHHFDPVPDADIWEERPQIYLAAGAMLKPGIDEAVKTFSEREGVTVNTSYAGCGLLVAQMEGLKTGQQGGRFPDAYFACDLEFLDKVQRWFDAAVIVARNDLVLIVPKGNPKQVKSLHDLARPELGVGLGHPTHSAVGKLTDDLLKRLDLHRQVYAEGHKPVAHADAAHSLVGQVCTGALDVAVVYRSSGLITPANVERYLDILPVNIPEALATQPFAIAKDSQHKHLLRRLLATLVSAQSAARFRALGFHWVHGSN